MKPHLFCHIERTVLNPGMYIDEQHDALDEVTHLGLAGLTVSPFWVKKFRRDMGTRHPASLATVVGFPYGYQRTEAKQTEVEWALKDGACDIEVVVNTSALFSPTSVWIKIELAKLVSMIHEKEALFTVVIESALLTDDQLKKMIKKAADAGADYIKDATGVLPTRFSVERALKFRREVPRAVGVKIVGDGASPDDLRRMVEAGIDRISLADPVSRILGQSLTPLLQSLPE
ncbi:deoxyribose-phosphate aldolase [Larkinella soli]|uniref:deoxyribose-phosphate aldolase n=1 Tax=Larkinella soli TaxID=1770527 RepID=UPI001E3D2688|nr:deoxyribose-phosphate aldolase [Larkinella soli]